MIEHYYYRAKLDRVIDGDTVDLCVDCGFNIEIRERFRLINLDAPETRTKDIREKMAGLEVKQWLQDTLEDMGTFNIKTAKKGKFGRWLVEIFNKEGTSINDYMIEQGLAQRYED